MGLHAYRVQDVRAAEDAALAATSGGALMQTAAAALAVGCVRLLRRTGNHLVTGRRIVLLVGAGNNGGDALWAGARLAARGAHVVAVLTGKQAHAEGLAALRAAGGREIDTAGDETGPGVTAGLAVLERAELVVDGLVGLGARPGLREPAAALVAAIRPDTAVVAVDLPSGVDPETGAVPAEHVWADLTVTFGAAKPCLLLPPASLAAGDILLVDLGFQLPDEPQVERLDGSDVARLWPVPAAAADKYRRGVLGVIAGSADYPGAAVLAVSGALRAGVGMIRYIGPRDATAAVRSAWPEVVAGPGRVQAWLLGSGVSADRDDDDQPAAIAAALERDEPCLVDAGGLSLLVQQLQQERDARVAHSEVPDRSDRLLLTPHAGELATLLTGLSETGEQVEREDVEREPYRYARRAAEQTGATVLLKGATTVIVRPDGRARSQAEAPPWLATAGAGDVLAGIAAALLAGGLSPFDAGAVAAFVHGTAAAAASGGGPIVAGDVAAHLGPILATLLTE